MANTEDQEKTLGFVGNALKEQVNCYLIGGGAMLLYNLSKTRTNDVDIVAETRGDRKAIVKALLLKGFTRTHDTLPAERGEPVMLELGNIRLDVFAEQVFRLRITKDFWSRAREKIVFGNLTVFVASLEDVMLLKSLTDRPGDRKDAETIIKETTVDWGAIEKVIGMQFRNDNFNFVIRVADFFDDLKGMKLPIPKKVESRIAEYYSSVMDRVSSGK